MDKKRFVVYHSAGAFITKVKGVDDLRIVEGTDSFTDDNGYGEDEIRGINNLNVGQMFQSHDYGFYHWIVRID